MYNLVPVSKESMMLPLASFAPRPPVERKVLVTGGCSVKHSEPLVSDLDLSAGRSRVELLVTGACSVRDSALAVWLSKTGIEAEQPMVDLVNVR